MHQTNLFAYTDFTIATLSTYEVSKMFSQVQKTHVKYTNFQHRLAWSLESDNSDTGREM
jgi:hypothetical protein